MQWQHRLTNAAHWRTLANLVPAWRSFQVLRRLQWETNTHQRRTTATLYNFSPHLQGISTYGQSMCGLMQYGVQYTPTSKDT